MDLPRAHEKTEKTEKTGRVTGGRGAGDADTTDTTAPAACDAPRGRGSAIGTVGADQSRGGGRRRSVIGDEGGTPQSVGPLQEQAAGPRTRRSRRGRVPLGAEEEEARLRVEERGALRRTAGWSSARIGQTDDGRRGQRRR